MAELHKANLNPSKFRHEITSKLCSFANKISLHVHEAAVIDTTKYLDHSYLHHCHFKGIISLKQYACMEQARKQAYLFVNAGRYMGSYTADVDLRLDAPKMTF